MFDQQVFCFYWKHSVTWWIRIVRQFSQMFWPIVVFCFSFFAQSNLIGWKFSENLFNPFQENCSFNTYHHSFSQKKHVLELILTEIGVITGVNPVCLTIPALTFTVEKDPSLKWKVPTSKTMLKHWAPSQF